MCSTGMWQHIWPYTWTPNNMLRPQRVCRKSEETQVGDNNNMQCKRKVEPVEHENAFTPPSPRMEYRIQLEAERIVFSRSRDCIWECQDNYSCWFVVFVFPSWTSVDAHSTPSVILEWGNTRKQRSVFGDLSLYTIHNIQQQVSAQA